MKIQLKANEGKQAVKRIAMWLRSNPVIQSNSWVMVRQSEAGSKVEFAAVDSGAGDIVVGCGSECDGWETMCVLGQSLVSAIQAAESSEAVELESTGNKLVVSSGDRVFKLSTYGVEEFPVIDHHELEKKTKVSHASIAKMFNAVKASIRRGDPMLDSVWFGDSRAVTADGAMMSIYNGLDIGGTFLIPSQVVAKIVRSTSDIDGNLIIGSSGNRIVVQWDSGQVTGLLMKNKYPDYKGIGNIEPVVSVSVDGDVMAKTVSASSYISSGVNDLVVVSVLPEKQVVTFTSASEFGGFEDVLPCKIDGEPIKFGISARYLRIAVAHSGIKMTVQSEKSPIIIDRDDGTKYIIMPMHTAGA